MNFAKRIISINIPKSSTFNRTDHSAIRISRDCFATAVKHSEGRNALAETRGEGPGPDEIPVAPPVPSNNPVRPGMFELNPQPPDMFVANTQLQGVDKNATTGATQSVADTAKEGIRKATEIADAFGEAAKKTVDSAWNASKDANENIRDTVTDENNNEEDPMVDEIHKIDGPVDTVEYRNMGEGQ